MRRTRRVNHDEELSLVEHLDELRSRLIVSLTALAVAAGVGFWQSEQLLTFLARPGSEVLGHKLKFIQLAPTDAFMASLSISLDFAILVALPVMTYQIYAYVIPAFAPESQKALRWMVVAIPSLFGLGVAFGWFLVLKPALEFLLKFNHGAFNTELQAQPYVQFIALLLAAMGIIFEMPVVMLVLARIHLVTSRGMVRHWRVSTVGLAFVAFILPGADIVSFFAEFLPLVALYWVSYGVVRLAELRWKDTSEPEPTG
jgi:sec-independent protein translocase protein TatC